MKSLLVMCYKIFSIYACLPFLSLNSVFWWTEVLNLMWSNSLIFYLCLATFLGLVTVICLSLPQGHKNILYFLQGALWFCYFTALAVVAFGIWGIWGDEGLEWSSGMCGSSGEVANSFFMQVSDSVSLYWAESPVWGLQPPPPVFSSQQ